MEGFGVHTCQLPVRRVGRLVMDRCADNFFAGTEQVAFATLISEQVLGR